MLAPEQARIALFRIRTLGRCQAEKTQTAGSVRERCIQLCRLNGFTSSLGPSRTSSPILSPSLDIMHYYLKKSTSTGTCTGRSSTSSHTPGSTRTSSPSLTYTCHKHSYSHSFTRSNFLAPIPSPSPSIGPISCTLFLFRTRSTSISACPEPWHLHQHSHQPYPCTPTPSTFTRTPYPALTLTPRTQDTLPEWSKGVDSSSTSASCVGSNPTGVNFENFGISGWRSGWMEWEEGVG